ncbi:DUF805 domain-containing protein [Brevundimonas sp.]|uniref:DUF805 domain-containing protein n=1 Tax=Brevundimonas sp. TaxID=1871086 RepID=UPI00391DEB1D
MFLAPKGRIDRRPFIVGVIMLIALLALFQLMAVGQWWHVPLGWVVYPVWVYAAVCVLAKRLHDRGRSGWWAGGVVIGFNFIWPYPDSLIGVAGLAVVLWATVELGWMQGEEGANRHGPPLNVPTTPAS